SWTAGFARSRPSSRRCRTEWNPVGETRRTIPPFSYDKTRVNKRQSAANTLGGLTRMNTPNPYAPPRANVYDVNNNATDQVPAERGTRFVAWILDGFIFGGIVYL